MKLNRTILALAISATILTACGTTDEEELGLTDGSQSNAAGINDASTSGFNNGSGFSGSEMGGGFGSAGGLGPEFSDPSNPLSKQTIYFMLDSSQVQQDFVPVIAAHSQYCLPIPDSASCWKAMAMSAVLANTTSHWVNSGQNRSPA
jgi:peptidoglycan-associated lipoprotein